MISLFSSGSNARRRIGALLASAALPLLVSGCSWINGRQSTFDAHGPVARTQLDVFYTTVEVTAVIFVLVASVLAYAIWKFRARSEEEENAAPPPQSHGNPLVELGLIGASVLALVIIAIPTLRAIWFTYEVPEKDQANAYEITATGYQWWWRFEYLKEEIELPNGAGKGNLVVGNELVIPAGRPIHINLRTADVIHSFWVPKLAGKVDLIPNRGNHIWLKADEPGYFWGQCAEYCGESHAVMRFRVVALGEKEFGEWLANQKKPARVVAAPVASEQAKAQFASYKYQEVRRNSPGWSEQFDSDPMGNWIQQQFPAKDENPALIARGRKLFTEKTCAGCHTVRGHEGVGITGPDLTHVGARTTIAAGLLENNEQNLHRWITHPNDVKPGNKMWNGGYNTRDGDGWKQVFRVSDDEAYALVAYLRSLK